MSTLEERIREREERARRAAPATSILATRGGNAQTAAKANRVARETGLPASTVERNLPDLEARIRARANIETVRRADPRTQEWFANPRNAAAAADDLKKMAEMGMGLALTAGRMAHQRAMVEPPKPKPVKAKPSLLASGAAVYGSLRMGQAPSMPDLGVEKIAGNLWAGTLDLGAMAYAALPEIATMAPGARQFKPLARAALNPARKALQGEAERVAEEYRGDNFITEGLLTGLRSVPLTVGAALTRNPKAGAAAVAALVGFDAAALGREKGMSEAGANLYGLAQAAPEFIFERAPIAELLKIGGTGLIRGTARYLAKEVPGELATTLSQSFTDWVALPENQDKSLTDWASGLPEELAQTALGVIGGGTITGALAFGAQKASDRLQQRQRMRVITGAVEARGAGAVVDQIMEGAQQVALREHDPEGFRDYVAKVADGTPVENVYIPAEAIRELFQDGDYSADPLFSQYAEQIEEATALNDDVVIPLAEIATHLAGRTEWSKLRERARFTPGGYSERDLKEIEERFQQQMQERVGQAVDEATAEASPTQAVYEDVYNRLIAIGRSPSQASRDATIIATQTETRAARRGMDALAYHQQRRLTARNADGVSVPVPQGRALDEAEAPEVNNRLYREGIAAGEWSRDEALPKYGIRNVFGAEEIEAIIRDGFMLPREGKKNKYFTLTDEEGAPKGNETGDKPALRVRTENIPEGRAVRAEHVEIWDAETQAWKPLIERTDNGSGDRGQRDGAGSEAPLAGSPKVASGGSTFHGPIAGIVAAARAYAEKAGIPFARQAEYVEIDEAFSKRLADAYAAMEHRPEDPAVAEAYRDLIEQTRAQYDALAEAGYTFTLFDDDSDPYEGKPWRAMIDLRDDQHLAVYSTAAGFGTDTTFDPVGNPLLAETGLEWPDQTGTMRPVLANDLFRAVHDAFGHGIEGAGFRAQGEENAWQAHARLFTGPALAALTTETRGQNSWLNFGPHGETNRDALLEDTTFGDQKTGLLPEWAWTERKAGDFDELAAARALYQAFAAETVVPGAQEAEQEAVEAWREWHVRALAAGVSDTSTSPVSDLEGMGQAALAAEGRNVGERLTLASQWPVQMEAFPGEELGDAPVRALTDKDEEIEVDGVMRPTKNADGNLIASTSASVEAFWRWFGDSKMVDEAGRPTVYYHGTKADLQALMPEFAFDPDKGGGTFFFAIDQHTPRDFARTPDDILPVYLALSNIEERDAGGNMWDEVEIDEYARDEVESDARAQWKQDKIDKFEPTSRVEQIGDEWVLYDNRPGADATTTKFDNEGEAFAELEEAEREEREAYEEEIDDEGDEMSFYDLVDEGYISEDDGSWKASTDDLASQYQGTREAVVIDDVDEGSGTTQVVIVLGDPTRIKHIENRGSWDAEDPRVLYQEAFYSALERAVEAVSATRAPAAQWLATLRKAPGVKAEELEWTGLEEWLSEQEGPVEKAEVQRVLQAGAITVEERVLGEPIYDRETVVEELENRFYDNGYFHEYYEPTYYVDEVEIDDEAAKVLGVEPGTKWVVRERGVYGDGADETLYDDEDEAREAAEELDQENLDEAEAEARDQYVRENIGDILETDAEYPSYSLASDDPVGMGYHELLLYFPDLKGETNFPSTHWSAEEGVVAHARFHDRRGPNGEKILFLDEIQSDWHKYAADAKADARKNMIRAQTDHLAEYVERVGEADAEAAALLAEIRKDGPLPAQFPAFLKWVRAHGPEGAKERAEEVNEITGYAMAASPEKIEKAERDLEKAEKERLEETVAFLAKADEVLAQWWTVASTTPKDKLNDFGKRQQADYLAYREWRDGIAGEQAYAELVPEARRARGLLMTTAFDQLMSDEIGNMDAAEQRLELRRREIEALRGNVGTPDAPFKTTWPMLVMKRVIVWAAQGGYDQVAWIKQGENNGGMNDNFAWLYEKVLPNETNKLLKKYGAKVRGLKVNGLRPALDERVLELNRQLNDLEGQGAAYLRGRPQLVKGEMRDLWEESRATAERRIETVAKSLAEFQDLIDNPPEEARPDQLEFYARRVREAQEGIESARAQLEKTTDFEAMWDAVERFRAITKERDEALKDAPTNLGFDLTPELKEVAIQQGFPLFQRNGGGPRGRISGGLISGTDDPTIIDVFKLDDPSTVMHEFGHLMLEELRRDAMLPDAPQATKDEWRAIEGWFRENGYDFGRQPIPTGAHELFARGWERYLMEGKAPVPTLQRVFKSFADALVKLYRTVLALNSPITPEVRRVFDLMLATHDEIEAAQDQQGAEARFANAEQAGMSQAEFDAYRKLADQARDTAFENALNRAMAGIRKQRTLTYRREKERVREEVTERVNGMPVFRALHLLRTGRFLGEPDREASRVRLDRAWIVDRYGEEMLAELPRGVQPFYAENADDPEIVANMAGFATAEEMVAALVEAERTRRENKEGGDNRSLRTATIEDEVNAIMDERHGGLLDEEGIEEEAIALVNNATEGEVIAAESRALAKRLKEQPTPLSMVREWAKRKIAQGRVVDVASRAAIQRYARAQAKAARAFEEALAAGNIDEAFRQSEIRLLNHALIVEAKKAADRIEVIVPRLNRVAQQRFRKSVAQEYWDRAHALLDKFEFRVRSQKEIDATAAEREGFEAWAMKQAEQGIDVVLPPRLEENGVHYTRMSVEELIELDDSVQQLLHLGRRLKDLRDAKEKRDFDETVHEAVAVVNGIHQRRRSQRLNPNRLDKLRAWFASADAALLKMEQVFDWLDDKNPNGLFNRIVFRPLADAQAREEDLTQEYLAKIRELMLAIPKKRLGQWQDKVRTSLLDRETGLPFELRREDLISIALNVGNEGNFEKLAGGYGWNRDTIMDTLNAELTAEEWQFVQGAWDLVDTLWPEIAALEKRVNGIEPERVEPRSFTLADGTVMRGGYYPVVYDPTRNYTTEAQEGKATEALFSSGYARATTRQGFAKERTQVRDRAILLSLSVLNRHLNEVIHDITHREAIMQADRFLADRRIAKAVDDAIGPEVRKQFRPWLSHVANQWAHDRAGLAAVDKLARTMRTHSTIIGMGFRITSVLSQFAGYAGIAERIGVKWMAVGMKAQARPGSYQFVAERSKEVQYRLSTMDRDIASNMAQLQGKYGLLANARRFAFIGIGLVDRMVVTGGWLGAYTKGMKDGMSEEEAAFFADKTIRESQGAGGAKDLSAIQRQKGLTELFVMFYSYAATFYNRQRDIGRTAGEAVRERDPMKMIEALSRSWWLMVVSPILGQAPTMLLSGYGPGDDDDEETTYLSWAAGSVLGGLFYGIPLIRDVASSAASGFDYQVTPAARMIETLVRAAGDLGALGDDVVGLDPDEETEVSKRPVKTAVESAGYVFRLPVGQVSNASQFLVDWATGDADPDGVKEWLLGLQRGKLEE